MMHPFAVSTAAACFYIDFTVCVHCVSHSDGLCDGCDAV